MRLWSLGPLTHLDYSKRLLLKRECGGVQREQFSVEKWQCSRRGHLLSSMMGACWDRVYVWSLAVANSGEQHELIATLTRFVPIPMSTV